MDQPKLKLTIDEIKRKQDRQELIELLAERAKHTRIRKEAEEMEKACTQALTPILERLNIGTIDADDDMGNRRRFVVVHGGSSTIDRRMLLIKGVSPDVIEECTKRTNYISIQVREIRDGQATN